MRVLLVDDNRLTLEGLQSLLEAHDIEVAGVAHDGLESVEMACALEPDVILMDVRMPGCSGLDATRLIKARMPQARIVMLTTSADDDDLFEAIRAGACGYLVKSIDDAKLVDALEQAWHGRRPGRAAYPVPQDSRSASSDCPFIGLQDIVGTGPD